MNRERVEDIKKTNCKHWEFVELCDLALQALDAPKGLSRRDMLAGMAMQGLFEPDADSGLSRREIAVAAVEYADALISELDRTEGKA